MWRLPALVGASPGDSALRRVTRRLPAKEAAAGVSGSGGSMPGCGKCGSTLHGRFCADCGQDSSQTPSWHHPSPKSSRNRALLPAARCRGAVAAAGGAALGMVLLTQAYTVYMLTVKSRTPRPQATLLHNNTAPAGAGGWRCGPNDPNIAAFAEMASSFKPVTDKVTTHKYQTMYGIFLPGLAGRSVKFLEVGLGCGMVYGAGASIPVWRYTFPCTPILRLR